jgi:hypothetical protein
VSVIIASSTFAVVKLQLAAESAKMIAASRQSTFFVCFITAPFNYCFLVAAPRPWRSRNLVGLLFSAKLAFTLENFAA